MKALERFAGLFKELPIELLLRLDRNFGTLAQKYGPIIVTTDFTFKGDDLANSTQVNATSAAVTVYLPASPTGNRRRTVTKTDASGNAVTVNGNGSLINGAATYVLAAQYDTVTVEPTGTGWLIV